MWHLYLFNSDKTSTNLTRGDKSSHTKMLCFICNPWQRTLCPPPRAPPAPWVIRCAWPSLEWGTLQINTLPQGEPSRTHHWLHILGKILCVLSAIAPPSRRGLDVVVYSGHAPRSSWVSASPKIMRLNIQQKNVCSPMKRLDFWLLTKPNTYVSLLSVLTKTQFNKRLYLKSLKNTFVQRLQKRKGYCCGYVCTTWTCTSNECFQRVQ